MNRATLDEIISFIKTAYFNQDQATKIPTGLVVAGPSIASHAQFFDSLAERAAHEAQSTFVALSSNECPNLKTLLKNLIRKATSAEDDDGDEHVSTRRKGPKLLNYDLQLLFEWCKEQNPAHVVITFRDSEAFEGPLLADAIQLLRSVYPTPGDQSFTNSISAHGWIVFRFCCCSELPRLWRAFKKSFQAPPFDVSRAASSTSRRQTWSSSKSFSRRLTANDPCGWGLSLAAEQSKDTKTTYRASRLSLMR